MGNEKYTQKVIEAFQSAQQIAALHYNQELSSVHMLMGLTKEPEGLLNTIFSECHTDVPMLQARLEQLLKKIPSVKGSSQLSMSTEMVRVIGKAQQLADSMHDEYISTEHILLGSKPHFKVQLIELSGRTIRPCILITEAGSNLEVLIYSGYHQQLLILLRCLWQCIKFSFIVSGRDNIISCSFRRRCAKNRSLYLHKSHLCHFFAKEPDDIRSEDHIIHDLLVS